MDAEISNEVAGLDDEGLSVDYDVVIYGTGLVESIFSCACAKVGKSVLHLDAHDHYGHESNSLPLTDFLSLSKANFECTKTVQWLNNDYDGKELHDKVENMTLESLDGESITSTSLPLKLYQLAGNANDGNNETGWHSKSFLCTL